MRAAAGPTLGPWQINKLLWEPNVLVLEKSIWERKTGQEGSENRNEEKEGGVLPDLARSRHQSTFTQICGQGKQRLRMLEILPRMAKKNTRSLSLLTALLKCLFYGWEAGRILWRFQSGRWCYKTQCISHFQSFESSQRIQENFAMTGIFFI